jgi:predicted patatin/cPLA2 family phospholipase
VKALVLSGGASKGAFTAGVVRHLLWKEGKEYDLAVGTSTGTLVAGPALLNDYDYCADVYVSVADKDIFQNSLIGTIATVISKFISFISGPIDAKLNPLRKLLEDYYFDDHKLDELLATDKEMIVSLANVRTGHVQFVSSNLVKDGTITRQSFISAIVASCSEPFFTKPIRVFERDVNHPNRSDLFYDGGVKEFLPIEKAISCGATEIWAISTHPMKFETTEWGGDTLPEDASFFKALQWTIGAFLEEVARGDGFRAETYYHWSRIRKLIAEKCPELLDEEAVKKFLYGYVLPDLHLIYPTNHLPTSLKFEPATMWNYELLGERRAERMIRDGITQVNDETLRPWELHSD